MNGGVQLPDDVVNAGYRKSKTNKFEFEQIFYSSSHDFRGSEQEFIDAGIAYRYRNLDRHRRIVLEGRPGHVNKN